jgi:serine/threonine-protein kinase
MLQPGFRVGAYEVVDTLGQGGMGEVYRARDTRLNRDVALKILPEPFAADADRLARFAREAQLLAALNHPNIAAIYGVEEFNPIPGPAEGSAGAGSRALVMELVVGQTLQELIDGRPMPIAEVLATARQIAGALSAAHDAGIIHRDLKPANIKVREDGTVKVLDFGLARAMEATGSSGAGDAGLASRAPDESPTMTSPALTSMGLIIGTAAYMSPEQARGKVVDRRADIWAFGVVLLEMLTGRRVFDGPDVTDVLAAVIKDPPPLAALPPETPVQVRRLLRRCLEKDRGRRLDSMGAARLEIEDAEAGVRDGEGEPVAPGAARVPLWQRGWVLGVGALSLVGLTALTTLLNVPRRDPEPLTQFAVELGAERTLVPSGIALSPDGQLLVVGLEEAGRSQLFSRTRDRIELEPIHGTEGGHLPFFSPDGRWLAFFTRDAIKKVPVAGGPAATICPAGFRLGATWGAGGAIVFATADGAGLRLVSAAGGEPTALTTPASGESHRWPYFLPDGEAVLYAVHGATAVSTDAQVAILDLETGESRELLDGTSPHLLPSGHLVFARGDALWVVRFDLARREVIGAPVPVVEWAAINSGGLAQYALSADGLAYVTGTGAQAGLVLVDLDGLPTPLTPEVHSYANPRFSPDGRHVAVQADADVWIVDQRGTLSRLTTGGAVDPTWTPDGSKITYVAEEGIVSAPWDGSAQPEMLTKSEGAVRLGSWSPEGTILAYWEQNQQGDTGLWTWTRDAGPSVWLDTPASEGRPEFSPDGRWIAYLSNESDQFEVYVREFPGPGRRLKVSTAGGSEAGWLRDGRLVFRSDGSLWTVTFDPDASAPLGQPVRLLETDDYIMSPAANRQYDFSPDGRQMVGIGLLPGEAPALRVIYGWGRMVEDKFRSR